MLSLCNIRFMNKVEGLFDGVDTPEVTLRVILDQDFIFPPMEGNTTRNITDWGNTEIPPVELPSSVKDVKIEFALYSNGELIARAVHSFAKGEMRNDALDTYDIEGRPCGKLVFEAYWVKKGEKGSYITKQQFAGAKGKTAQEGGQQKVVKAQVPTSKKRTYVRQAGDEDCGGLCGCFAVRKPKKKNKEGNSEQQTEQDNNEKKQSKVKKERPPPAKIPTSSPVSSPPPPKADNNPSSADYRHEPYMYKDSELEPGKPFDSPAQPKRLVHYSKGVYQC